MQTDTQPTAQQQTQSTTQKKLSVERLFTEAGINAFDTVEWTKRDATIKGPDGRILFQQKSVEFPASWSQLAVNVTTEKYFRGQLGTPEREVSLRQVISRVVTKILRWGVDQGYFDQTDDDLLTFAQELTYILLHQYASFNSPVWFNLGVEGTKQQVSACFIQSVKDNMGSIMDLAKSEVMLFKGGSGTGSNLSSLRGSKESLRGGGQASGPVSFMKGYDSFAGVTKSGGKTRRAAKMVILNADHPDIMAFIGAKSEEEKKAHALIDAGWDGGWNVPGGAYDSVQFQNANNSVRATDEFMEAVESGGEWNTRNVVDGEIAETFQASDVMHEIAENTHMCGDPGMQFDTTINDWHTTPNAGRVNASNPCSEYMSLDDTACNLASINLRKFERAPNGVGWFDVDGFMHTVRIILIAQDIMVAPAHYPTEAIGAGARAYRQLGIGFANLGGLLMSRGLAYDSDDGRRTAAYITDLMQATAYRTSAEISEAMGPFDGYEADKEGMHRVVDKHIAKHDELFENPFIAIDRDRQTWTDLRHAATEMWNDCYLRGNQNGYRNSQVSVLAPTGTIAFMMDCDTTGIEPEIALKKIKSLAGGGQLTLVNNVVESALAHLGYRDDEISDIVDHVTENGCVEGSAIKDEHLAVFDCSIKSAIGKRSLSPMAHIKMMEAVQPFLSGAISKTVNVDNDTTVEQIEELYLEAWRRGLKAVAVYRDGCKRTQPLSVGTKVETAISPPPRRRMDDERQALCHKFSIGGHEGYLHVGLYPDGSLGEMFITMAKEGSTISGMMGAFATSISIGLQHGVPIETFINKFKHTRFEPSGYTNNEDIRMAQSILDYIFRWLELKFVADAVPVPVSLVVEPADAVSITSDAPPCSNCGNITVRSASCYKCLTCGTSNGCS